MPPEVQINDEALWREFRRRVGRARVYATEARKSWGRADRAHVGDHIDKTIAQALVSIADNFCALMTLLEEAMKEDR